MRKRTVILGLLLLSSLWLGRAHSGWAGDPYIVYAAKDGTKTILLLDVSPTAAFPVQTLFGMLKDDVKDANNFTYYYGPSELPGVTGALANTWLLANYATFAQYYFYATLTLAGGLYRMEVFLSTKTLDIEDGTFVARIEVPAEMVTTLLTAFMSLP